MFISLEMTLFSKGIVSKYLKLYEVSWNGFFNMCVVIREIIKLDVYRKYGVFELIK